jgi:hypothetical protein
MTRKQKLTLTAFAIVLVLILGTVVYWIDISQQSDKGVAAYQTTLDAMARSVTLTNDAISASR